MKKRDCIILGLLACLARAEEPDLPPRVAECMKHAGPSFEIDYRLNPFYLRGDLDGDRKPDYAVLVKKGPNRGIVVCRSASLKALILGAGSAFNRMADLDFASWEVFDKRQVQQGAGEGRPPKLIGEAIWVEWSERASALIYWTGRTFAWYQQGD